MISVNRIKFNELSNVDLDLIVDVAFDSDSGDSNTFLNREAVANESYDGKFRRVHQYKYKDVFAPVFTFVKRDFTEFTFDEQRKVLAWLTSKSTASFLSVYYDDSNVETWEVLGGWIEINTYKNANNRTIGITATFEATTPWALSPLHKVTREMSEVNNFALKVHSDDADGFIYPRITIEHKGSVVTTGNKSIASNIENTVYYVPEDNKYYWKTPYNTNCMESSTVPDKAIIIDSITNDADWYFGESISKDDALKNDALINGIVDDLSLTSVFMYNSIEYPIIIKNNTANEKIVIDCANQLVSTNRPNRIFGNDFNWNWLPLFEGDNLIWVIGNCTVTFEWREPIKCGEW